MSEKYRHSDEVVIERTGRTRHRREAHFKIDLVSCKCV